MQRGKYLELYGDVDRKLVGELKPCLTLSRTGPLTLPTPSFQRVLYVLDNNGVVGSKRICFFPEKADFTGALKRRMLHMGR